MARDFGIPPLKRNDPAPIWPIWTVTFVAVSVINAAVFLRHG
jgi:hypothetical protein